MTLKKHNATIIEGVTEEGIKFRPSDWAERMCDSLSKFERRRVIFSPLLRPVTKDGIKCVAVSIDLESTHPNLYAEVIKFATKNKLKMYCTLI